MSKSNVCAAWDDLSSDEIRQRLSDLGLVLCEVDGVIICVRCRYALQPSGQTVSKHLWEKHSLPAKDRAGLNAFVRGLGLQDPNGLSPRPDESSAHPHLIVQRGVTCLQCRYRTTSPNLLQRHIAKEHGQQKRRDGSDKGILWAEADLQSWSQNGKRDFWMVKTGREDGPPAVQQSPRRKRRLSQIRREEVERVARRQQSMEAGEREDPLLSSNWMRRTGWTKLFVGTDRSMLVALSKPPTANPDGYDVGGDHGVEMMFSAVVERRLAVLSITIDRFLDRCEDTLCNTDHSIRCYLRSHFPGRSYKSPFELPGRDTTRKRYRSLWKRMVYFCVRIHLLEESLQKNTLRLPFSADLQLATKKLWSEFMETRDTSSDVRGDLLSHQSGPSTSRLCPNVRHQGGADTPTPLRSGDYIRSPMTSLHDDVVEIISDSDFVDQSDGEKDADEEYMPSSSSESEYEDDDEEDAMSLASMRANEDLDQDQSVLRTAL